ncbi:hypothetical protein Tsubulata_047236 [Turnera subulata]|uniref:Uncharacterized protein n=1 Tax=Turnera subulata TaxID=218843 RepID=A0A9Q0G9C6_9ROSI|nr:hypothetical protein Tsubulata_047236 [Turnera subulata]
MRQFRAFKCFTLNKYVSPLESEDIAKRWTTVSMQEGGHVMKFKITDFKILDRVISGLVGKSGITCLHGGALAIEQTIWLCNAPYADRLLYPSHRVSMAQDVGYGRGKGAKSIHNPTDRELDSIVFDEENSESEPSEISLCLVGTLWTERPFNAQAFMRTMKQPNESRRASPRTSEQDGEKSGEVGEHSLGSSNIKGRVDNQIEVESISSGSYPIKAISRTP